MDNSFVTVEVGFVWPFQCVTQFQSWLNTGLPRFCHCKFHKQSLVCGKDANCWQAPTLEMTMLKVKEDMVTDCKVIFFT